MVPSRFARRGAALLGSALAIAAIAAPAAAHVSVPEGDVHSGSSAVIHFRVPHGCDGAATDTVEIQLPEGVVSALPEYVPGWALETEMVPSEPYDEFGTTKTERVGVIRWSGGDLPDHSFYDFGVRAKFLSEPGTVLAFPVVQRCGDVEVAWIEPVVEGQEEPEHPTPTVTVVEPAAEGDEH